LIAKIAQHQELRACTQRHQGDKFAILDQYREGAFTRDVNVSRLALLIDALNLSQRRGRGGAQARCAADGRNSPRYGLHHECVDAAVSFDGGCSRYALPC
jgi:hypothetical protein